MKQINQKLLQNAIKNGITTDSYKFIEFKIKDNDEDYKTEKYENL